MITNGLIHVALITFGEASGTEESGSKGEVVPIEGRTKVDRTRVVVQS